MNEFINAHIYLCGLLIWACFYIIGVILLFKQVKSIFLSSLFALPQALFGLFLVPVYWNPDRNLIVGIGLEDLLFSFFVGGLTWMGSLSISKYKIAPGFILKRIYLRFLVCTAFGFLVAPILYHAGIKDMLNPFITMIVWIIAILIYNRDYFKIVLTGSFSFLIIYGIGFKLQMLIWIDYIKYWSWENILGICFWGIPIEELIWAFLYGGSWCMTMAFILNVEIDKK